VVNPYHFEQCPFLNSEELAKAKPSARVPLEDMRQPHTDNNIKCNSLLVMKKLVPWYLNR